MKSFVRWPIRSIRNLAELGKAFPERLRHLPPFDACALVDYPLHANPGDQMVFLAALLWLSRQCDPARIHVAHRLNFSVTEMQDKIGRGPVFCVGGGNLGDLWRHPQRFREKVIQACPDHAVILLPQCMHFVEGKALLRAQRILNAHPNLTIMLRDHRSFDLARKHFDGRLCLAPDQAILLTDIIPPRQAVRNGQSFYLRRPHRDREARSDSMGLPGALSSMPAGNWECMGWKGVLSGLSVLLNPGKPTLLAGRRHPLRLPGALEAILNRVDRPGYVVRSWRMIEQCVAQLEPYETVVTDRFHGHILCALREIPHTVIGNNHHKIRAHWETWFRDFPDIAYADSTREVGGQPIGASGR